MTFRKLASISIIGLAVIVVTTVCTQAADDDKPATELFLTQNQAGLRLGLWSNRGELPPESGVLNETGTFTTNIGGSSAYIEGFFGYRLTSRLVAELSLGTVNRGSVTLADSGASDIGNLVIYPVLVQLKLYAPRIPNTKLHPFVFTGGGLHFGRRNVQFTNSPSYYPNWVEDAATNFNYVVGGGFDWPIGSSIGLDFTLKYMPINMSLVVIEKWDALAFTVGVKYLYSSKQGN